MQKIVLIVVVIVLGLLAYNYFTTGELSLMPAAASGEDGELNRLRGDFRAAAREFRQAGRSAAVGGIDTTDAAAAALEEVERVEKAVEALAKRTEDPELKSEAEKLLREIRQYKSDIS